MPNSPITKKFLQDELFKYNTEIAKVLNLILSKFEQVDQRFEQIDQRFEQVDQRFDGLDKVFVTKNDWANQMDQIMGELKAIREEQAAHAYIEARQDDQLENHEEKIKKIQTHLNLRFS